MRPIALSAALATAALLAVATPAAAQSRVDLAQFDGRWFEVMRNPNDVQKDCSRAQIDWTAQEQAGRYGVVVTCTRRSDGQNERLRANARVTDTTNNSRFRMTLTGLLSVGGLVGQNYVVWDHAPDYSWAIMGLNDKSNWWVWTRTANPSEAVRTATLARARALGFNTARVVHTGR